MCVLMLLCVRATIGVVGGDRSQDMCVCMCVCAHCSCCYVRATIGVVGGDRSEEVLTRAAGRSLGVHVGLRNVRVWRRRLPGTALR
jgi:ribosomal protein L2